MTVRLTRPGAAGHLDQAPVSVNIVSAQARDVLAVPVSALVALAGGGYAVEVVARAARAHLVGGAAPACSASTLVQVSGPGLTRGHCGSRCRPHDRPCSELPTVDVQGLSGCHRR